MSAHIDAAILSAHLAGVSRRVLDAADNGTMTPHEAVLAEEYLLDKRAELEILSEMASLEREEWSAQRDASMLADVVEDLTDSCRAADSVAELHADWFEAKSLPPITRKSATTEADPPLSAAEQAVIADFWAMRRPTP